MKAAAVSYLNWIQIQEAYLCARVCVCALEVETHLRPGTKEDVFPRATEVEEVVWWRRWCWRCWKLRWWRWVGAGGFGSFSPRLAKHSAGSTL